MAHTTYNKFCERLLDRLNRYGKVTVYECSQVSFDKLLNLHHMRKEIDYTRHAKVLSQKGHRRDIDGYVYELCE
jgi:hypothetical protein